MTVNATDRAAGVVVPREAREPREIAKTPSDATRNHDAVAAQKDTEQVSVMNGNNQSVTLYIDVKTHLPVKKSYSWRDPTDKQRNFEDEVYDNYRLVQGIMTPFDVTRFYNGDMSNQRFLKTVSYNQGLSDNLFNADVTYDPYAVTPKK